ncbi:hypothetical protein CIW49_13690 [Mycolicibacterium sp. P1-18]|uniref:hypothetical protein n=1 Tax=Mycolicibacterium sp. P1-18 TaxID=2024615 RepID=UPI0011F13150|nr:hypothetical protein [Mycolicibacterium sp. P1-18]KAA0098924.1 hypothetical protein CIW49_13690 [Mycolicibacterium sp. P1-18]
MDIALDPPRHILRLPENWQPLKTMPDDPPGTRVIGYHDAGSEGMVLITPVSAGDFFMPFDQTAVISGIRPALAETDSGLVEAATGRDLAGHRFVYTIIKGAMEPAGMQYTLTLHIESDGPTRFQIQGFFSERGTTGVRDALVQELKQRDGTVRRGENGLEGWLLNPYDDAEDGLLMNLSESREYDGMFPNHPLTQARWFAAAVSSCAG